MVILRYKFKSHGSKGRWYKENVKTVSEARRLKKFIGSSGKVQIISRGKLVKRSPKRKKIGVRVGMFRL